MMSSSRENEIKVNEGDSILAADEGTPYRLPSLSAPQQPPKVDDGEKILLSLPTVRLDLSSLRGTTALKTHPPPYTPSQLRRAQAIQAPKFSRAHFAPEVSSSLPQLTGRSPDGLISPDVQQISISKKITARSAPSLQQMSKRPAYPTQNRRLVWKLSPHPHRNYDAQSLKGIMGPYSREFVVHCTTPKTWLRMKLSKSL